MPGQNGLYDMVVFSDGLPIGSNREDAVYRIRQRRWSGLIVPLIWAAAGDNNDHPLINWLCEFLGTYAGNYDFAGERVTRHTALRGFSCMRSAFRQMGIIDTLSVARWLTYLGFQADQISVGTYLRPDT